MTYGDGINSSTLFTTSLTTTIPANSGGASATGRTSATLIDQYTPAGGGTVTVHALAQVPPGGAVSNPVGATMLLMVGT